MSDYMFMLESHLTPVQRKVVADVEAAGAETEDQLFLTGGAMRDMMGGYQIVDLDFTVQGNAPALVRKVVKATGARVVSTDKVRKSSELVFPSGVTAEIAMAHTERFTRPGAKPKITPCTIHDDLLRRDFTINSIALSLHPASRGLLLDPSNGLADLEHRELRSYSNYSFYDSPVRLLRLIRFRVRLGFDVHERTLQQYRNARDAEVESLISPAERMRELREIANQVNGGEVVAALENENLLHLFSPALSGSKLNMGALSRLEKARQLVPYGSNLKLDNIGVFLYFLTEKLTSSEKSAMIRNLEMEKPVVELWQKLPARCRTLEKELKSQKLHRASELYHRLIAVPGDQILFLYLHTSERIVHDRLRNFLQKYLLMAQEITDRDVTAETGLDPSDEAFAEMKGQMIDARLDGRKWTPPAREKRVEKKKERSKAASRGRPAKKTAEKAKPAGKSVTKKARKEPAVSAPAAKPARKRTDSSKPSKAVKKAAKPAKKTVRSAKKTASAPKRAAKPVKKRAAKPAKRAAKKARK